MRNSGAGEVAVVGGGVIGIACARALQRRGLPVRVFEPGEIGGGCSAGNAGHIAIDHVRPLARLDVIRQVPRMLADPLGPLRLRWDGLPRMLPWLARFALAAAAPGRVARGTEALGALLGGALPAWKDEIAATPGLADLFRHQGSLTLFETGASFAASLEEDRILAEHGVRCSRLDAAAVADLVPDLRAPPAGGRLLPDAAHVVDPLRLVRTLAEAFAADGGAVERARVAGLRLGEDGQVRAVLTEDGGEHPVAAVVIATGAVRSGLTEPLGAAVPVTAERGYHVMLDDPGAGGSGLSNRFAIPVTFAERGFIATPMREGLRLAGTVELGGAPGRPDWRRADILLAHMRALFRGFAGAESRSRWFGDRPTLPDYLPMIGPAPRARNVVLALGHQHLGLTLAAVTGALVADLVASGGRATPPLDLALAAFRADRFGLPRRSSAAA
jgi:D-amino-acid dehydrogenase